MENSCTTWGAQKVLKTGIKLKDILSDAGLFPSTVPVGLPDVFEELRPTLAAMIC